jgi:DNA-directed RNA polymerase specialized sigma24 family protein
MMPNPEKKGWDLTESAFGGLLDFLDPNRERAAAQYETLREKLIRFFEWKGCIPGDGYADETIDRVARRLEAGIESRPENPYLFFHGVAVNIVRERWRKAERDPQPLETLPPSRSPAVDPADADRRRAVELEEERRLECLQDCLDRLPPHSRELLTIYHLGGTGVHIGRRKDLAQTLNIPASALRLRVFRIRRQIEDCMGKCVRRVKDGNGLAKRTLED